MTKTPFTLTGNFIFYYPHAQIRLNVKAISDVKLQAPYISHRMTFHKLHFWTENVRHSISIQYSLGDLTNLMQEKRLMFEIPSTLRARVKFKFFINNYNCKMENIVKK